MLVARDRTEEFVKLREARRPQRFAVLDPSEDDDVAKAGKIRLLQAEAADSPPATHEGIAWLEVADECRFDIDQIKLKLGGLQKIQQRRLFRVFENHNEDSCKKGPEKQVEELSQQIAEVGNSTGAFLPPELRATPAEFTLRANARKNVLRHLQDLSKQFRLMQERYISELRKRGDIREPRPDHTGGDLLAEEEFGVAASTRQRQQVQLQRSFAAVDTLEAEATAREHEIDRLARTMGDLSILFKELDTAVLEQGTVLDRIDYNLERVAENSASALHQIVKAEKRQRSSRATRLILFLAIVDTLLRSLSNGCGRSRPVCILPALSPLDGRYSTATEPLKGFFSEGGFISYRFLVERRWFQYLLGEKSPFYYPLSQSPFYESSEFLETLSCSADDVQRAKELEKITNHDVKAIEYLLKEKVTCRPGLKAKAEWIHFGCTSEDINNVALHLALQTACKDVLRPKMMELLVALSELAADTAAIPMLSLTHGQPATPTTFGKEVAVFLHRLLRKMRNFEDIRLVGKFNGAVGNYNAHREVFPAVNWQGVMRDFIESLELEFQPISTQIECHDRLCEVLEVIAQFNDILLGLCRDFWYYISLERLRLKRISNEVGSSTMPHKINPIDFENAEGNLGLANSVLRHLTSKLPISRMQRDLSDSTVLRNIGTGLGYSVLAWNSILRGCSKLTVDKQRMADELESHWELLAEPIQMCLRKSCVTGAYEELKSFSRGNKLTKETVREYLDSLKSKIPQEDYLRLVSLRPATYVGDAEALTKQVIVEFEKYRCSSNVSLKTTATQ